MNECLDCLNNPLFARLTPSMLLRLKFKFFEPILVPFPRSLSQTLCLYLYAPCILWYACILTCSSSLMHKELTTPQINCLLIFHKRCFGENYMHCSVCAWGASWGKNYWGTKVGMLGFGVWGLIPDFLISACKEEPLTCKKAHKELLPTEWWPWRPPKKSL